MTSSWTGDYSRWRHDGWYVHNVRYPSGAIGCVSRNYPDRKWRIVCYPIPGVRFENQPTFRSRDEAARAEYELVAAYRQTPEGQADAEAAQKRNDEYRAQREERRKES